MTSCLKLIILTTVAILLKYFYTSELVLKNSEIFFSMQMSTHAFHWKSFKKSRNLKSIQKLKNLKHFMFSIVCASTTRFTTFNFVLVNNTHFVLFTFSSSSLASDTGCWWVVILLTAPLVVHLWTSWQTKFNVCIAFHSSINSCLGTTIISTADWGGGVPFRVVLLSTSAKWWQHWRML